MQHIKHALLFSLILFISLSIVSATDINDTTDVITDNTPVVETQVSNEVAETNINDNNVLEDTTETQTCTGRTYSNPISITPENYEEQITHIYDNGYDAVEFSGTFTSTLTGGSITITNPTILSSISGATFEDTQFIINSNDVTIKNLIIENDNNAYGAAITATGYKNIEVINNTITVTKTTAQESVGIKIANSNNTTVCKNTVNVSAVPQSMGWDNSTGVWLGAVQVSGILYSNVNNSKINCNNVTVNDSTTFTPFAWSTADGITVKGGSENTTTNNNNVNVTGSEYNYGISLSEFVKNITVYNNTITMETINQLCGIQLSAGTESTIKANKIYGNCTAVPGSTASCEAFAYGIVVSTATYGASDCESYYNTIEDNEIRLNSTIAYGIELNNADYNNVTNNNVHTYGNVTMGIGLYNSSYNNITNNILIITGETRALNSGIYEAIYPETTGIKLNETSTDNNIVGNHILVTEDSTTITYSIILLSSGNTVDNNYLTSVYYVIDEESGDSTETILTPITNPSTIYQNGYNNNIGTNDPYQ